MTCRTVTDRLGAYLDGDLLPREQAELEQHLASCSQCRAEAAALRHAEDVLQMLRAAEPAPDLLHDLRRRLAVPPARGLRFIWAAGGAAAVGVAVLVLLLVHHPRPRTPEPRIALASPKGATHPLPSPVITSNARTAASPSQVAVAPKQILHRRPKPMRAPPTAPSPADSGRPREEQPFTVPGPEPTPEPEATESVLTGAAPTQGVIVLLGQPEPILPSSSCYLEVSFPDGAKSVTDRTVERDAAGRPRAVQIAYENTPPEGRATN